MKSINITYTIIGIFFVCIFIYCVLQRQRLVQSCSKKAEIASTEKEIQAPKTTELAQNLSVYASASSYVKTSSDAKAMADKSADKTSDKKKNIRKRIKTKDMIMTLKQIIPEIKTNNAVISHKHIPITNNITKEMLTYHHWTGNHAPTTFVISVDGVPLHAGESINAFCNKDGEIVIRYDYSFLKGYKTGSREIYFEPKSENQSYSLSFSWQTPMHLLLENAEIKKAVVVDFNKLLEN